jgi:hypothetical protein
MLEKARHIAALERCVSRLKAKIDSVSAETSMNVVELARSSARLSSQIGGIDNEVRILKNRVVITPPVDFDSPILSEFPPLLDEFRRKHFSLLWRGSRDGFGGHDFHRCCDGIANTLTLIKDTDGNIFGGFTPVAWESRDRDLTGANCFKPDPSRQSFIFTLKNPRNFPPRRFPLKDEKNAIYCNGKRGPHFHDIRVSEDDQDTPSSTEDFGTSYANDTRLKWSTVFTGSEVFQVSEIEVFHIPN